MGICSFGSSSIVGSWILTFWSSNSRVPFFGFPPVRICSFLSKLVKASHLPSDLLCSASEHARVHAPSVPTYTDGSKSSEGVGYAAVFPDFDVFISVPVVASIFIAEFFCYFPCPFSYFVPRQ